MSEQLYPSGRWVGFYNYQPGGQQHRMELTLTFAGGVVRGDGRDDLGLFFLRGRYDSATGECHWTKSYIGAHDVFYRGFREGKGIWGTWEIQVFARGGFQIWPVGAGEGAARSESDENTEVTDAVATEELTQPAEIPSRF